MLRFANFKKSFGRSTILEIDNLIIDPGVYWVKGINGSGKTTLLKSIAGIINFDGDIFIDDGVSIKKQPVSYRALVNFAEAEPIFPTFLSGDDMIRLFSQAKRAQKNQYYPLVEQLKMDEYLADPIGSYSSGMLKKLSLVLAFLGSPRFILLDEPLITLDNDSLTTIRYWIAETNVQNQVTFLLSSHQHLELTNLYVRELIIESKTLRNASQ